MIASYWISSSRYIFAYLKFACDFNGGSVLYAGDISVARIPNLLRLPVAHAASITTNGHHNKNAEEV